MRSRNAGWIGIEHIRRRDEHHVRQIERHAEIVVAERKVLLRVEDFEQCRRRIAAEVGADLVDFIHHEHRIVGSGLMNALNDASRHRADIRAAMTADFRFIVHAAQAHAHEFAAERTRDGLAQRSLSDARRADEAEDRALRVFLELANGEMFDDAFLDLLEAVVIFIEDFLRFFQIEIVFGGFRPGQLRSSSRDSCAASPFPRHPDACVRDGRAAVPLLRPLPPASSLS